MPRSAADEIAAACLGNPLRMIYRAVAGIYEDALRRHDLTITRLNVLAAVASAACVTPKELCKVLRLERYETSKEIAALKSAGLVAEEPARDGRTYHVVPTPAGLAKLEQVRPAWRDAQQRVGRMLGQEGARLVHSAAGRLRPESGGS